MAERGLDFVLVDEDTIADIPLPATPGARCQTCDYWERLDGTRRESEQDEVADVRAAGKQTALLSGRRLAGSYGMLAYETDAGDRRAVGWCQFGPISHYPRAQLIRERYAELPDSPAPWVVTCLQVAVAGNAQRSAVGEALLRAVCEELNRRGVTAVETYPERAAEAWVPSTGPAAVYEAVGFEHVAGDERYPAYRRELGAAGEELGWGDLLRHTQNEDAGEGWPLPLPKGPSDEDFFRLPPEKPKRPNPFGED